MASGALVSLVSDCLARKWARCPVIHENDGAERPKDGSPFLIVHYPVSHATQKSVGTPGENVFREEGVIRFILNVERGSGLRQGLTWCDELAALFRAKRFGEVVTEAPTSPVIHDHNDNGNYFTLSFVCPYQTDITG